LGQIQLKENIMNQPELGLKVAQLRAEKGLTQEQLAETCQVTARTIQRIEAGEVEPRAFTRNSLSNVLEFDLGKDDLVNERFWLAALHLSSVFCIVFIPLLIWSWLKNRSYQVDQHGRQVLNFQITMTLALFVFISCLLIFLPISIFIVERGIADVPLISGLALLTLVPLLMIGLFATIQGITNTIRLLNDQLTHYPLSIQFIR
jgi:uncharacterized Tic20 family protein